MIQPTFTDVYAIEHTAQAYQRCPCSKHGQHNQQTYKASLQAVHAPLGKGCRQG